MQRHSKTFKKYDINLRDNIFYFENSCSTRYFSCHQLFFNFFFFFVKITDDQNKKTCGQKNNKY